MLDVLLVVDPETIKPRERRVAHDFVFAGWRFFQSDSEVLPLELILFPIG